MAGEVVVLYNSRYQQRSIAIDVVCIGRKTKTFGCVETGAFPFAMQSLQLPVIITSLQSTGLPRTML